MQEQIYTIPVLDGLRTTTGCPFCAMREKLETDAVAFILGPAYMENDVRIQTNKAGFCSRHNAKLYAEQNRLGLALMLHTHLQQLNKETDTLINGGKLQGLLPFKREKKNADSAGNRIRTKLRNITQSCYLCQRIDDTFARYMDTFFHLWQRNKEAAELIKAVDGFCLPHFAELLEAAEKHLDKTRCATFLSVIIPLQHASMQRMQADLDWFIKKFDYRYTDEPWKNAKDALPRTMAMLNGRD